MRAVINQSGAIAGKNRRVLDSTVLDDAVALQDTITMLVTQIRRVRKLIPELAGVWVHVTNLEGGRPPCDWDDPTDIDRVISELVEDANELVWAFEDLIDAGVVFSELQADLQSPCWRSSPARTSNLVIGPDSGGSPCALPLIG